MTGRLTRWLGPTAWPIVLAGLVAPDVWATAAERPGHQPSVTVGQPTRLDWVFVVANRSREQPPPDWLQGYDSTAQTYELYVPVRLGRGKRPGLVLFVSPGEGGIGLESFRKACDDHGLVFASPHRAGNGVDGRQRVRIVLDVLDDVWRRCNVDPDRCYVGGFSGGGRIACGIAFSLPEQFGGVIPVCAAGDLREEPWLRHRVIDRLGVALLTGVGDFNRGEVERFRGPMLSDVGVRTRTWVAEGTGHAMPPPAVCGEAVAWLEQGLADRVRLARGRPSTRATVPPPSAAEFAASLLAEGRTRLGGKRSRDRYEGLMLVKGVADRWSDLEVAAEAGRVLAAAERSDDLGWEEEDVAEQRRFLIARARGLSAYATGQLPPQYAAQRSGMAAAAIELWTLVIEDGVDAKAAAEGRELLDPLRKLVAPGEP